MPTVDKTHEKLFFYEKKDNVHLSDRFVGQVK